MRRPCLDCGAVTPKNRCPECQGAWAATRQRHRPPRPHYAGDYRKRAAAIRDQAETCWLCGAGPLPNDPWQADHYRPGDPDSPLIAAHRSCNARRGNRAPTMNRPGRTGEHRP